MIRPLKHADSIEKDFVVCDIENRADGTVIWVDVYDGQNHFEFPDWKKAYPFIVGKAQTDLRFRKVYAHNGGGWDWISLADHLLNMDKREQPVISAVLNGSKMIMLSVVYAKDFTIHFVDTMNLFYTSLDKIATKLLGKGKVKLDALPEVVMNQDYQLFVKYCRADTQLLYDCIVKFSDIVYESISPIQNLGVTLPATAMKVFRQHITEPIMTPMNPDLKNLLREGYRGGRVEVFKSGYYEKINVYDINSLYPYVMSTVAVPVSSHGYWTKKFRPNTVGVWRIKFKQKNQNRIPILMVKSVGEYQGEGVYFSPEVDLLHESGADITVEEGFVFEDTEIIFKDYVQKLYAMRMANKGGPLDQICKLFLNSLYGKFGQVPERKRVVICRSFDDLLQVCEEGQVEPISESRGIYSVTEKTVCSFEHVGIAGMITSAARRTLYQAFTNDTVYCDTDSVHTTKPIDRKLIDENTIGKFKLEYTGEGVYVGKKIYALRNPELTPKEKIRVKGVKCGGEFGAKVTFEDIRSLLAGEERVCYYHTPTTPTELFKGKKSCVFTKRKRTIRQTAI